MQRSIKTQLDRYTNFFSKITDLFKKTSQDITIGKIRNEFDKEFKKVLVGKNEFYDAYGDFMIYKQKNKETTKLYQPFL